MQLLGTKKNWLRVSDLLREFSIPKPTAYDWITSGCFGPAFQPNGINSCLLFPISQVEACIRRNMEKFSEQTGIAQISSEGSG